ncbi:hypothetical protein [Sphingomonas turrisvirgatae]|nr:hypothetical protein [Sphingomonas turrisvirgatae]
MRKPGVVETPGSQSPATNGSIDFPYSTATRLATEGDAHVG